MAAILGSVDAQDVAFFQQVSSLAERSVQAANYNAQL